MNLLTAQVRHDDDVAATRSEAKRVAGLLNFDRQDQVRIATVTSELARNALRYAGGGSVRFSVDTTSTPPMFVIQVTDHGPGIRDLPRILSGNYQSTTGLGVGLLGARRLMDAFEVQSSEQTGTHVRVAKRLPRNFTEADVRRATQDIIRTRPRDSLREVQIQNEELLGTLSMLAEREERLQTLNQELEDTNRGVVALYAELEEKAERLREANQLKTRFLSYVSHEFRTPLNSMLGLARILLARLDGELTPEQQKQVELIQGAAGDLLSMVNDLLDLAKVEAGKTDVQVTTFEVTSLFATLRALFQPLVTSPDVRLVFDEPHGVPPVTSDEGKVAQVLRNFISNALKFTARGEVRVQAALTAQGTVRFSVQDTGIGIPLEAQPNLFQEFTQVHVSQPNAARGTGLGLSIARNFTELLGGRVGVRSAPGEGSLFYADIPLSFPEHAAPAAREPQGAPPAATPEAVTGAPRPTVLIVDDNPADRYLLVNLLSREHFDVREAHDGASGIQAARAAQHHAILLDLSLPDLTGFEVLTRLRSGPDPLGTPVLMVTSQVLTPAETDTARDLNVPIHSKARLYQNDASEFIAALWQAVQRGPHE